MWCGWACPQTLFLEHVYRRVERWIDGDSVARKALESSPWTTGKIYKRILKHILFIGLSLAIAHLFLSYFVSIPQLWTWIATSPLQNWKAFVFVMIVSAALYANFAWFREQLCLIICPYGRLQSALVDEHSINVAYDYNRGNPPGPARDPNAGDCIDCRRCVQVCPTGIDIRQGLQLECIACTACIDACDEIMTKVKRPQGLIRYVSEEQLEGRKTQWIRPRTILYSILLFLGMSVAGYSLMQLQPIVFTATRMAGAPYIITETGVRNQYQVRLVNKTNQDKRFFFTASAVDDSLPLAVASAADGILVRPLGEVVTPVIVSVSAADFPGRFPIRIEVHNKESTSVWSREVDFLGPDRDLLRQRIFPTAPNE
ncbi:MAG: cytochrome c oxidase accessory protein CcoG [Verrucomicrobia bacterium]|nr:cytochrome c oxidase accessory protein CcoG [Verrucomicrobiota bacterium]